MTIQTLITGLLLFILFGIPSILLWLCICVHLSIMIKEMWNDF